MERKESCKKKIAISGAELLRNLNKNGMEKLLGRSAEEEISQIVDKEYRDIKAEAEKLLQGWFCYRFASYESSPALYLFCTVGSSLSNLSREKFDQGDYLKGVLADLLADQCLFSMENIWKELITEECKKKNLGIIRVLEAEKKDSAEIQKKIFEALQLEEERISLTSKFMYRPSKSMGYVFILGKEGRCSLEHDCERCQSSEQCMWKNKN